MTFSAPSVWKYSNKFVFSLTYSYLDCRRATFSFGNKRKNFLFLFVLFSLIRTFAGVYGTYAA